MRKLRTKPHQAYSKFHAFQMQWQWRFVRAGLEVTSALVVLKMFQASRNFEDILKIILAADEITRLGLVSAAMILVSGLHEIVRAPFESLLSAGARLAITLVHQQFWRCPLKMNRTVDKTTSTKNRLKRLAFSVMRQERYSPRCRCGHATCRFHRRQRSRMNK